MRLSLALGAATLIAGASAECANGCSGHGACGNKDQCVCYDGYTAADCSQRICPYGLGFVDIPNGDLNHDGMLGMATAAAAGAGYSHVQWSRYKQPEYWPLFAGSVGSRVDGSIDPSGMAGGGIAAAANEAHFYAECSGKGSCDRETGMCQCYDGYTGSSCQRTVCPNSCSGHGVCRTVGEIASGGLNKRFLQSSGGVNYYTGVQEAFSYRLWDADKNSACVCDPGYSGIDCSLRECPRGDDPLTAIKPTCGNKDCVNEVQGFTIVGTNPTAPVTDSDHLRDYFIRFHDYFTGAWYDTAPFQIDTWVTGSTPLADAQAHNAVAIKNALESLPNNVTGQVTVSTTALPGSGAIKNARILVTFDTLPGNVPEMEVLRVPGSTAADPAAQPSQPLHVFDEAALTATTVSQFTVYPLDTEGFRFEQFTTADSTTPPNSGAPDANYGNRAAYIKQQLQGAAKGIPAFIYDQGTTNTDVLVAPGATAKDVYVRMPNKQWGANPIKLVVGSNTYYSTLDTADGNKEFAMCSNRGMCDFASGLCQCFPGYVGTACETQNALAM